jgi:hypothetical protein
LYHEQLTELLTSPLSADVEELTRALGMEKEKLLALEIDVKAARTRIVVTWRLLQLRLRGVSGAVK